MKLDKAYSEVIKYNFLNTARIRPFLKNYNEAYTSSPTDPEQHLHKLADMFDVVGDPRGEILKRHLGITKHPEQDQYDNQIGYRIHLPHQELYDTHYIRMPVTRTEGEAGDTAYNYLTMSPVAKKPTDTAASAVHLGFNFKSGDQDYHAQGLFTPEEARQLIHKFPVSEKWEPMRIMRRHFSG